MSVPDFTAPTGPIAAERAMTWLARYQVKRESVSSIAASEQLSEDAVLDVLRQASTLIGLRLRLASDDDDREGSTT